MAGLLEEDAVATDESKIIDNAWRGAEVMSRFVKSLWDVKITVKFQKTAN